LAVEENRTAGSAGRLERAVLVGVDLGRSGQGRPGSSRGRAGVAGARLAVRVGSDPAPLGDGLVDADDRQPDGMATSNLDSSGPLVGRAPSHGFTALNADESLAEFRELVASAGGVVAAEVMQRRAKLDPATLIGAGKVEEIAGIAASTEADLVLFDHDLSPTQLRNLEAALPCRVLELKNKNINK